MTTSYRIVDVRPTPTLEFDVDGKSPELAASKLFGMSLVRSGLPKRQVCRVYWKSGDDTNVVKLYERASEHH